jgi:hypothetical protein
MFAPGPVVPTPTTKAISATSSTASFKPATFKTSYRPKPTQTAKPKATAVPARAPINISAAKAKTAEFVALMIEDIGNVYEYASPERRIQLEKALRKVNLIEIAMHHFHAKDLYDFEAADSVAGRVAWLFKQDLIAHLPHAEAIKKMGTEMTAALGHPVVYIDVSKHSISIVLRVVSRTVRLER